MEVDSGIKIKGQAKAQVSAHLWPSPISIDHSIQGKNEDMATADLQKRENELKEKALRNKVVRSRNKGSGSDS
jgi:serine/arginine repetitive matrix protein 1